MLLKAVCAGLVWQDTVIANGEPENAWKISENLYPPKIARSHALFAAIALAERQIPNAGDHDVLRLIGSRYRTFDASARPGLAAIPENAAGMA